MLYLSENYFVEILHNGRFNKQRKKGNSNMIKKLIRVETFRKTAAAKKYN